MGVQVALKKPLCINSSLVNKIDKLGTQNTETIYSCSQYKKVTFSNYFYDYLPILEERFKHLEVALAQLGVEDKFTIVIDDIRKDQVLELVNGVQVGSNLLETKLLEKTLIQLSLKNKLNIRDEIFLQSLSDFIINDGGYQNLISRAWGESFNKLYFFNKRKISKSIVRNLLQRHEFSISDSMDSISKLKLLLKDTDRVDLSANFNKNLNKLGYYSKNELSELKLDLIIEENAQNRDAELIALANSYPALKVAVKKMDGLYLLPSNIKIPRASEKNIFTKYRLIFDKPRESKILITNYLNNSESLILINSRNKSIKANLRPLFASGLNEFLFLNKELDFIQIHLPSYKLKSRDLSKIVNYFDFVKIKKLSKNERLALGWSHSKWLKDLNAFKPIANYDVIQYFRVN